MLFHAIRCAIPVPTRVTQRAAAAMNLAPGMACFAILKSMAVARDHVAGANMPQTKSSTL